MRKTGRWGAWLVISVLMAGSAWADCDNADLPKAIGIEEPWIENAAYVFAKDRAGSPTGVSLTPEADLRLARRVGMEIDFPTLRPALSQVFSRTWGAGLKVPLTGACAGGASSDAPMVTAEIEGQYTDQAAPSQGSGDNVTAQTEWAFGEDTFSEGETGYTKALNRNTVSGWFLNTSVGQNLAATTAVQLEIEIDNEDLLSSGRRGLEGSILPQIAFRLQPSWLLSLGEQLGWAHNPAKPRWATWIMAEREFD